VDENTFVGRASVRANEGVFSDRSTEGLDSEDVADDFFSLAGEISVDQGNVVVGADAVTEGGEALFNALDLDGIGKRVAEMLELLISGNGRNDEAVLVAGDEAADGAGFTNGGVDDGDVVGELLLEDGVEVLGGTEGTEAVGVCELGEDTDVVGRFEAGTEGHFLLFCFIFSVKYL